MTGAGTDNGSLRYARRGIALGLFTGVVWGLDGVLLGIALAGSLGAAGSALIAISLAGAALHDGIAAVWLLIANAASGKLREIGRALAVRPGRIVCAAALLGGPVGMAGYLLGITHAGAAHTLAVSAIYPAIGSALAVLFLKERIPARAWVGILVCVAGAVVVGWSPPVGERYPHFATGIAFALMAAFGWGLESVLSTRAMDVLDPEIAINVREAVSFIVYMAVLLPVFGGLRAAADLAVSGALPLIAAAALCGAVSYSSWYKAMNMTGAGRAMALSITYVFWSIVFCYVLPPHIKPAPGLIVGAVLISGGTLLIVGNPKELVNLRNK